MKNVGTRENFGMIADSDTLDGFMLADFTDRTSRNYQKVTDECKDEHLSIAFKRMTEDKSIGVLLINQQIAMRIREEVEEQSKENLFPCIIEIPSKTLSQDFNKDPLMKKIAKSLQGTNYKFE